MATYELRVDPQQAVDILLGDNASIVPAGAIAGDILAFRPVNIGKGKAKDKPLLYKVEPSRQHEADVIAQIKGSSRRVGITVSSQVANSFEWIIAGRTTEIHVDLV